MKIIFYLFLLIYALGVIMMLAEIYSNIMEMRRKKSIRIEVDGVLYIIANVLAILSLVNCFIRVYVKFIK